MKEEVILNSGSSTSCKEEFCDETEETIPIWIRTNGGSVYIDKKCRVSDIGTVYYNEDSLTNIIGLKHMRNKYHITYSSQKESLFLVHKEESIVKFRENKDGKNATDMKNKDKTIKTNKVSHVNTVADNLIHFSQKQQAQPKKARELYHTLGMSSKNNLKSMIRMNLIRNKPVTVEDVNIAMKIYGPNIRILKGKIVFCYKNIRKVHLWTVPSELFPCSNSFGIKGTTPTPNHRIKLHLYGQIWL